MLNHLLSELIRGNPLTLAIVGIIVLAIGSFISFGKTIDTERNSGLENPIAWVGIALLLASFASAMLIGGSIGFP